jgi:hypothetical protein
MVLVATPMEAAGTVVCTTAASTEVIGPSPRPVRNIAAHTRGIGESAWLRG